MTALCWGCGAGSDTSSERSAVDIDLVVDPNINATEQVVAQVRTVILIVDSAEGLYRPGQEAVGDGFQIKNADSDTGDLEIVITAQPVAGRLPRIRLERGGLDSAAWLRIKALGFSDASDGSPIAVGQVKGVTIGDGVEPVTVPFNLVPSVLPPRVVGVDALMTECVVTLLTVQFSKAVDDTNLASVFRTDPSGGTMRAELEPTGRRFATLSFDGPGVAGAPPEVSFELSVSTDLRDTRGVPLDDIPQQQGSQPYVEVLTFPCRGGTSTEVPLCGGGRMGQCADGFECRAGRGCVASTCSALACGAPYVCDPESVSCEIDCRSYGDDVGVCAEGRTCDTSTGLCTAG